MALSVVSNCAREFIKWDDENKCYNNPLVDLPHWFFTQLVVTKEGNINPKAVDKIIDIVDRITTWVLIGKPEAGVASVVHSIQKGAKDAKNFLKMVDIVFIFPVQVVQKVNSVVTYTLAHPKELAKAVTSLTLKDIKDLTFQGINFAINGVSNTLSKVSATLKFLKTVGVSIPLGITVPLGIAGTFLGLGTAVISTAENTAYVIDDVRKIFTLQIGIQTVDITPTLKEKNVVEIVLVNEGGEQQVTVATQFKSRTSIFKFKEDKEAPKQLRIVTKTPKNQLDEIVKSGNYEKLVLSGFETKDINFLIDANLNYRKRHMIESTWQLIAKVSVVALGVLSIIAICAPAFIMPVYVLPLLMTVSLVAGLFSQYVKERGAAPWKERFDKKITTLQFKELLLKPGPTTRQPEGSLEQMSTSGGGIEDSSEAANEQ